MANISKVTSVTGELTGDQLGITLTHEHIHMIFDVALADPPAHVPTWPKEEKGKEIFNLKNLGVVRQYPYSVPYNLKLDDEDSKNIMLDEILRFKQLGGKTIVENTIHGLLRNVPFLKQLSLDSGVNIIAGTGYYVAAAHRPTILSISSEDMFNVMMKELMEGCEDGIKCGIVGEIGCSWPIHPFEKNMIKAVAAVQQEFQGKIPITFHPGRNPQAPFEIIRLFTEAGGSAQDVVMSHIDRTIFDRATILDFAELKTFTQYDLFGTECSHYQYQEEVDMPSDAQRIERLGWIKANGNLSQILISHDIHSKHRLANFGGHGYGHILQNIVPKMKARGFTPEDLNTILVENPKRWLCR